MIKHTITAKSRVTKAITIGSTVGGMESAGNLSCWFGV